MKQQKQEVLISRRGSYSID